MGLFARRRRRRQLKVAPASPINDLEPVGLEDGFAAFSKSVFWWTIAWLVVSYRAYVNASNAVSLDYLFLGLILDITGPVAVASLLLARRERRRSIYLFCCLLAALSLTWSLYSALSTAAHGTFSTERQLQHDAGQQAVLKAALKAAETELAALPATRPAVAIEADIAAVIEDPRSNRCEEIDGKFSKTECPKVTAWRKELGTAKARDAAVKRIEELRARQAKTRPVAELEPGIEFVTRTAQHLGYKIEPDTVRLSRTVLYIFALEVLSSGIVAWVTWMTRRRSIAASPCDRDSGPPDALAAPAATGQPAPREAAVEPNLWLWEALDSQEPLPAGIERRNGGLQGSYTAFAAAWGTSPARAQRLGREWQRSGAFAVVSTSRGTWIGPAPQVRPRPPAQLRVV